MISVWELLENSQWKALYNKVDALKTKQYNLGLAGHTWATWKISKEISKLEKEMQLIEEDLNNKELEEELQRVSGDFDPDRIEED